MNNAVSLLSLQSYQYLKHKQVLQPAHSVSLLQQQTYSSVSSKMGQQIEGKQKSGTMRAAEQLSYRAMHVHTKPQNEVSLILRQLFQNQRDSHIAATLSLTRSRQVFITLLVIWQLWSYGKLQTTGLIITHSLPQTTAQLLTNTNTALGVSAEGPKTESCYN